MIDGRSVFYISSGNSMWPLVQSNDASLFYPIQAVTAEKGRRLDTDESEITKGDIVFCQCQRKNIYYAHIVWGIEAARGRTRGARSRRTGSATSRRPSMAGAIAGTSSEVPYKGRYYKRPFPKDNFDQVTSLVERDLNSSDAANLCEPD